MVQQWRDIRGNFKYDILKAVGGGGLLTVAHAILRKGFTSEWIIFGGVFSICLLLFIVGSRGPRAKATPSSSAAGDTKIRYLERAMRLGELWNVESDVFIGVSIELVGIQDENHAGLIIDSASIKYNGSNVKSSPIDVTRVKYILPRASVAHGSDSVGHWDFTDATFNGFWVLISHVNIHAKEATVQVYSIDALDRKLTPISQ